MIERRAADRLLGISRPTLMKMIRTGEISSHRVGTHHRLKLDDVYAARREQQRQAMRELLELEGDDFSRWRDGMPPMALPVSPP